MTQTAVCNRHRSVEQQHCRWLLLSLDRLPSDSLTMTQDLIADMLGVRRRSRGSRESAARLADPVPARQGGLGRAVTRPTGGDAGARARGAAPAGGHLPDARVRQRTYAARASEYPCRRVPGRWFAFRCWSRGLLRGGIFLDFADRALYRTFGRRNHERSC